MSTIEELLARARERAGLTQRALSAAADIPQASVSRIERGLISPRASTVERWLEACGMTLLIAPVGIVSRGRSTIEETIDLVDEATEEVTEPVGAPAPERVTRRDRLDWAPWMS